MKKNILILLILISLNSFSQFSFLGLNTSSSVNGGIVNVYLNTSFGDYCEPSLENYAFSTNIASNEIALSVTYRMATVAPAIGCNILDTFSISVPDGTYNLTVCVDLIGIDINTQLEDTITADCDTSANVVLNLTELNLNNAIKIMPNPASEFFQIETEKGVEITRIELITLDGKIVNANHTAKSHIDVSSLSKGNYLVIIHTEKGVAVKKLMVE